VTMKATLIALAVVLAGCTTFDMDMRFVKAKVTPTDASRDEWECHRQTADEPRSLDLWIGGLVDAVRVVLEEEQRERLMVNCMRARGYEPTQPNGWVKSLTPRPLSRWL
jgi:hypothetical protein